MKKIALSAAALLSATAANAHYLWIEQPEEGNAVVRFGEFNEGLIEQSPGRMDEMPSVEAFAGDKPLTVTSLPHGFLLSTKVGKEGLTAHEGDYAVKDWRANGIGLAKPMYYARFGPTSMPRLDLDIVAAATGGAVQIFLHGRPLSLASVNIYAPNGWSRSERADKDGRLTIITPWRGQYVLEVIHAEVAPGSFKGVAYDIVRHRATLTLIENAGAETFAVRRSPHVAQPY